MLSVLYDGRYPVELVGRINRIGLIWAINIRGVPYYAKPDNISTTPETERKKTKKTKRKKTERKKTERKKKTPPIGQLDLDF